ncbi:MAG: class I SAM-dependent methyltransferase [Bacillota bacterium]|jgi:16S rRNA (guanine1207-N2)-methyltransferase
MEQFVFVEWYGRTLRFATHEKLFAPRAADRGSMAMLRAVDWRESERVLDLGCGYGLVGICAAVTPGVSKVVMIDNDPLAVEFARRNVRQLSEKGTEDGVEIGGVIPKVLLGDGPCAGAGAGAEDEAEAKNSGDAEGFTLILSNPPYHTDFSVAKKFIERGFDCLALGGRMMMVVKRLAWYQNKMSAIFGGVKVREVDDYYILTSEKRTAQPKGTDKPKQAKTTKKHRKKMMAKGKKA